MEPNRQELLMDRGTGCLVSRIPLDNFKVIRSFDELATYHDTFAEIHFGKLLEGARAFCQIFYLRSHGPMGAEIGFLMALGPRGELFGKGRAKDGHYIIGDIEFDSSGEWHTSEERRRVSEGEINVKPIPAKEYFRLRPIEDWEVKRYGLQFPAPAFSDSISMD